MGRIVALVAAVQFACMVDFMMVLPLAPDLAAALGFPAGRIGWLTLAYALASAISGVAALRLLDRYDRKAVLLLAFGCVILATVAAALASTLAGLLVARALTGLFAGPAIAIAMAILIDSTAPAQRGRALARVAMGFSLAVIAGVPLALELSRRGGWQSAFVALAVAAALIWLAIARWLPPLRAHLDSRAPPVSARLLLARPAVRRACAAQAVSQFSAFLVIPHFSAYFLLNLGFPREYLGAMYCAGGVAAWLAAQLSGWLADRFGPPVAVALATLVLGAGLAPFVGIAGAVPLAAFFILFIAGNTARNVGMGAANSCVPEAGERGAFMSLQNVVQDVAMGTAGLVGSQLIWTQADGKLGGMAPLAMLAGALAIALPFLLPRRVAVPLAA